MKIHQIESVKKVNKKRVGRGISAGQGKTAGRGTKGQKSRSGGNIKPGFEGGQTKLVQRLPKVRGFRSINNKKYQIVNLDSLEKIKSSKINAKILKDNGLIKDDLALVKILGNGKINKKLSLEVDKISASALAQIEKSGGNVVLKKKIVKEAVKK